MTDAETFERAADALFDVLLAMEDVDLNALDDDDVRSLLACKEVVGDMTSRYRQNQHALEDSP